MNKNSEKRKGIFKGIKGIWKIMLLTVASLVGFTALTGYIYSPEHSLTVFASEFVSTDASASMLQKSGEESSVDLTAQHYPRYYLNEDTSILESSDVLSAEIAYGSKREAVYVVGEAGEYAQIMTENGITGFVRSGSLTSDPAYIFDSADYTMYASEDTVLLTAPNGGADAAADVPFNTEITVTGTNNLTYYRVSVNGTSGFMDSSVMMDEMYVEPEPEPEPEEETVVYTESISNPEWDGTVLTASAGTIIGPSGKETYYNLNMSGVISIMQNAGYNYEYWIREDGVKMYGDYVLAACAFSIRPRGSLVETSLGTAICADTGGFANSNPTQIDIAVDW